MNSYNIQMVSKLTGISIHTLRAWEKRYQAVVPKGTTLVEEPIMIKS